MVVEFDREPSARLLANLLIQLQRSYSWLAALCWVTYPDVLLADGDVRENYDLLAFVGTLKASVDQGPYNAIYRSEAQLAEPTVIDDTVVVYQTMQAMFPLKIDTLKMASPLQLKFKNPTGKALDILYKVLDPIERQRRIEEVRKQQIANDKAAMILRQQEIREQIKTSRELVKFRQEIVKTKALPDELVDPVVASVELELSNLLGFTASNGIKLLPAPDDQLTD